MQRVEANFSPNPREAEQVLKPVDQLVIDVLRNSVIPVPANRIPTAHRFDYRTVPEDSAQFPFRPVTNRYDNKVGNGYDPRRMAVAILSGSYDEDDRIINAYYPTARGERVVLEMSPQKAFTVLTINLRELGLDRDEVMTKVKEGVSDIEKFYDVSDTEQYYNYFNGSTPSAIDRLSGVTQDSSSGYGYQTERQEPTFSVDMEDMEAGGYIDGRLEEGQSVRVSLKPGGVVTVRRDAAYIVDSHEFEIRFNDGPENDRKPGWDRLIPKGVSDADIVVMESRTAEMTGWTHGVMDLGEREVVTLDGPTIASKMTVPAERDLSRDRYGEILVRRSTTEKFGVIIENGKFPYSERTVFVGIGSPRK